MSTIPEFARDSQLLRKAFELALDAHHPAPRGRNSDMEHPTAVARLLSEQGFDDEVVAAGLLHEVLEDTDTEVAEIEERFGAEVAELVRAMTEDATIEPYEARKAEHRARVARSGARAASIYAADKLAKMLLRHGDDPIPEPKLEHYRRTLEELRAVHPQLTYLDELEDRLRAVDAEREHAGRR